MPEGDQLNRQRIIYDTNAYNWGDDNFQIATWNELAIYELAHRYL